MAAFNDAAQNFCKCGHHAVSHLDVEDNSEPLRECCICECAEFEADVRDAPPEKP